MLAVMKQRGSVRAGTFAEFGLNTYYVPLDGLYHIERRNFHLVRNLRHCIPRHYDTLSHASIP